MYVCMNWLRRKWRSKLEAAAAEDTSAAGAEAQEMSIIASE